MPALELKNIVKRFQNELVLNDVSFSLEKGETLVLFGPSGAGKTVLLRMIAGVITSDKGAIFINDKDMSAIPPDARNVGMAFQNFALFPHMSAFENIASPLRARNAAPENVKSAVKSTATLLKIDHVLDHAPKELSNGQKQRTALARALTASPELLLLDDPLRNVDAKLRFEMRLELPRLLQNQGATVVYVTQDYKEAMALGDRIAVLDTGEIKQLGTPEDVYSNSASVSIAQLFGDPAINLIEVSAEQNGNENIVNISDSQLTLNHDIKVTPGKDYILGVRPESLQFVPKDTPNGIPITIETETPLNEKIVTLVETKSGQELLLSRPANAIEENLDSGRIFVKSNNDLLLFNKQSGQNMHSRFASPTAGMAP